MKTSINMDQLTQQSELQIDKVALFQQKLVQYLKSDISEDDLKKKTGFDKVELNGLHAEFQRPVLTGLAAFEEAFHVNQKLKTTLFKPLIQHINEKLKEAGGEVNDKKLEVKPDGKLRAAACANEDTGIRFNAFFLNYGGSSAQSSGWGVNTGEGMPFDLQTGGLRRLIDFMHECGHQDENCLVDSCLRALPDDIQEKILGRANFEKDLEKIDADYKKKIGKLDALGAELKETNELLLENRMLNIKLKACDLETTRLQFKAFVCRQFMQYAMEQTEKEYGEKPIAGLIFKPGGRAKSLSLYASSNTRDFYAELCAKVLLTHPDHLTPLGKTLRKHLNNSAPFIKWFREKFNWEDYEAHAKYWEKHHGYEECPKPYASSEMSMMSTYDLNKELQAYGFTGGLPDIGTPQEDHFAIEFKLISNYNKAMNDKDAEALQRKLADTVAIMLKLQGMDTEEKTEAIQRISNKYHDWQIKKSNLLFMSEYCNCSDISWDDKKSWMLSSNYAALDTLDVIAKKDPKDFETPEACEKFLDQEIAAVEKEIKAVKEQQTKQNASNTDQKGTPIDIAKKESASMVPVVTDTNNKGIALCSAP